MTVLAGDTIAGNSYQLGDSAGHQEQRVHQSSTRAGGLVRLWSLHPGGFQGLANGAMADPLSCGQECYLEQEVRLDDLLSCLQTKLSMILM